MRTVSQFHSAARTPVLVALSLMAVVTGCGGSDAEMTFDAEGFIEAANGEGAGLELGEQLLNEQEGVQVRSVRLGKDSDGSLTVATGTEGATAEYRRCEAAVSLLCYRAANVVLIFEDGLAPPDAARLEAAIRALESD